MDSSSLGLRGADHRSGRACSATGGGPHSGPYSDAGSRRVRCADRTAGSALTLLDAEDHSETTDQIRSAIESLDDVQIADLHLWRIGAAGRACILSIVTHDPRPVEYYKRQLQQIPGIDHLTVEVLECRDQGCRTL